MILLLFSIFLMSLSLGAFASAARFEHRARTARKEEAVRELSRTKLQLSGDPLGSYELKGEVGGTTISLCNRVTAMLPGSSGEDRVVCRLTFDVSWPDLVICRLRDQDAVMGLLPNAPRIPTGDSRFDHEYVVFAGTDERTGNAGFRTGPLAPALGWANPVVIQQLLDLQISWARVQKGRCELALVPLRVQHVSAALTLAHNFATGGRAEPHVTQGDVRDDCTPPKSPLAPLHGALLLSIPVGFVGTFALTPLSSIRELTSADVCGPGGEIVVLNHGDSFSLMCWGQPGRELTLHYAATGALSLSLLFSVSAVLSVRIFIRNRRKERS